MLSPAGSARSRGKPTAHPATRPDSSSTAPWEGTILLTLLAPTSLCPRAPSPSPTARDWKSEWTYCYNVLKSNVFSDDQSKINNSGFLFFTSFFKCIFYSVYIKYIYKTSTSIHIFTLYQTHSRTCAGRHAHMCSQIKHTHVSTLASTERGRESNDTGLVFCHIALKN